MRLWKFYAGRETFDQRVLPLDYPPLLEWEDKLAHITGGFTRYDTYGHWVDHEYTPPGGNAKHYKEPSLVYEVVDFDHSLSVETMNALRHELRVALDQLSVLLTLTTSGEVIHP